MKKLSANKMFIGVVLLGVVALGVVGFGVWKFVFVPSPETNVEEEQVELPPVDSSVKVDLVARDDKKAVNLKISSIPKGTESIEYELSYDTSAGLPKGALGTIRLKDNESSVEREILLGTCSRNVCKYDEGVTKISLVLRFNHPKGSSQFQKEYEL